MKLQSTRLQTSIASLVFLLLSLVSASDAKAQLDDAGDLLRAGAKDANLLMESYLRPFSAGFGADLNSGWVNTAGAYKPFGFDLRVNAAVSVVPASDQLFSVNQLALEQIELLEGPAETPTISGDDFSHTVLASKQTIPGTNERLFSFPMPQGAGYPYVPAPMTQLTLGVGFGSDISVRYLPSMEVPDVASVGLWGIGLKHELNRWIPGGSLLPFDLSLQAGYTSLSVDGNFEVQPEIDEFTEVPAGYEADSPRWDGQGVNLDASGFTGNLLIGKTLPVLSLYAGVGFQTSSMKISTPGSYPIIEVNENGDGNLNPVRPKRVASIEEPLDLEMKGQNRYHAMAGLRIRLAILTISGSYTLAKYPVANVGIGLSLR